MPIVLLYPISRTSVKKQLFAFGNIPSPRLSARRKMRFRKPSPSEVDGVEMVDYSAPLTAHNNTYIRNHYFVTIVYVFDTSSVTA